MSALPHLRLENTAFSVPYTAPGGGGGGQFTLPPRDRLPHAQRLKTELGQAEAESRALRQEQGLQGEPDGDVVTVRSRRDFKLKLDSLERRQSGIELLSVSIEDGVTVAKVFVPCGKYVQLLALIDAYETRETGAGEPRNKELIESIEAIRLAAIRDFWQDTIPFPGRDQTLWWEVWLRRSGDDAAAVHGRFSALAADAGMRVSEQFITFPERVVTLSFGTSDQLSSSLDLLFLIAELRQAKELASDYVELPARDQRELIDEVLERLVPPEENAPAVCILDSGVNRAHPLLSPALRVEDTQSIKPEEWGTADDHRQHGTEMAGIALYGNLTDVFTSDGPVVLRHRLESVKFLPPPPGQNAEKDYGPFTGQAVARAEIQAAERNRAFCMAVTADDRDLGLPSAWSAAVDQLCSGALDDGKRLLFVSAGNLREEIFDATYRYAQTNCEAGGIEDPGQSWNAVTVGAYTEKVFIQNLDFRGWNPVADAGDLSPTSRTSLAWPEENQRGWPFKPDVLFEGGNYAERNGERSGCPDLALLTTTLPGFGTSLLQVTCDTSPATALGARMAATVWSQYPRLWPETIRGLIVHSAVWTEAMIRRFPGRGKAAIQQRLRCFGYGAPLLQRALWSAENAATLVYEGELQPFTRVRSEVRSNEMHLHRLPWPVQVLQDLGETDVTMRVTLSYFIEPSPGRIGWTRKHRYQSHGLRFDVNRPLESEEQFRQRLSRAEWEDDERPDNVGETRNWIIGDQGRRRGSLHADWWSGTATELASSGLIAVYPVTGWWRERPHLNKWDRRARYSLIVTIETPREDINLYAAIANQAAIVTTL